MIHLAEHMSYKTCEQCGDTKTTKMRGTGWLITLCDECAHKLDLTEAMKEE